uniref:Uncharacterized protein n=1 Tax=Panthera leo TaxID=9689 RepID=A0A8C8XC42_PANLE
VVVGGATAFPFHSRSVLWGPAESPAVRTTSEPRRSSSSAHRHLSRRNGLAKLCQSRMALSGTRPFWASWVAVSKTQARGRSGLWPLSLLAERTRSVCGRRCWLKPLLRRRDS